MLISVITPTWDRHDLLMSRCLPSVYAQTYAEIEHVIVSDGPDRVLAGLVAGDLWRRPSRIRPVIFDQLSEHLDGDVDYGSRARNRGLELATGEYIAYLDDDNAYRPKHLQRLGDALKRSGADFGFSRMQVHRPGGDYQIGGPTPAYGQIDTSIVMHRRGVPEKWGMWPLPGEIEGDKHAPDWGVVSRWLDGGATWVFLDQVTVDYYFAGA